MPPGAQSTKFSIIFSAELIVSYYIMPLLIKLILWVVFSKDFEGLTAKNNPVSNIIFVSSYQFDPSLNTFCCMFLLRRFINVHKEQKIVF